MSSSWYPAATKSLGNPGAAFNGGPFRGVLHTTEGGSAAGAIGAYKQHNSWPHFTVDRDGKVYQHIGIDVSARALQNRSGGVETNRDSAIQIEVVGWASKPDWPLPQVAAMILLMRWIEAQTGIKPEGPTFGDSKQYGLRNPLEFMPQDWDDFNGWCGHQHVPENDHWDPGAINLSNLLPTEVSMPDTTPNYDIDSPAGFVAASIAALCDSNGVCTGYLILGTDGGVFGFGPGARYFGRVS
jgi:hypothetical protein